MKRRKQTCECEWAFIAGVIAELAMLFLSSGFIAIIVGAVLLLWIAFFFLVLRLRDAP